MATYTVRGTTHNVVYTYKTATGKRKQQWESYPTAFEAIQRKAYIDYLKTGRQEDEIRRTATEYRDKREAERIAAAEAMAADETEFGETDQQAPDDNMEKTYREFVEKWLPYHARKQSFSPNTYDSYSSCLNNHLLPYFGDKVMSAITSEDVDDFLDEMSRKPCKGSKSYGKEVEDTPTLGSASLKKSYNVLIAGFTVAKKWRYIAEVPDTTAPVEKSKKQKAWNYRQVYEVSANFKNDKLLHLAVHLAFICSLRAGETSGIDANSIDFEDKSLWIRQNIQRVSDAALKVIPPNEVLRVFPPQTVHTKTKLILKGPKTERSVRKLYLPDPLLDEIKARLEEIEKEKQFYGDEYNDYGLLIAYPDGRPVDPKTLNKSFRGWQQKLKIENQIEFQGLRKSGQMHKVRLTNNNYQLVAGVGGHSAPVLMNHYDEALDEEQRELAKLVESSFYPQAEKPENNTHNEDQVILEAIRKNPELLQEILRKLYSGGHGAGKNAQGDDF